MKRSWGIAAVGTACGLALLAVVRVPPAPEGNALSPATAQGRVRVVGGERVPLVPERSAAQRDDEAPADEPRDE